jgi:hypothetical protein
MVMYWEEAFEVQHCPPVSTIHAVIACALFYIVDSETC